MLSEISAKLTPDRFRLLVFILIVILFIIIILSFFPTLPEEAQKLPYYAVLSVSRIGISYIFSFIFALSIGFLAASNKRAEKILLPALDIFQSVPVVGFFPAAISIFIYLFNGERIGIEAASIFLIFTSQAWNMVFGVYESIKVIPKEVRRLKKAYGIKGPLAFRKIYFPATIHSLIYNSMVSWANSWFFLMATEIFAIGAKRYELPGLGFFLWKSSEKGNLPLIMLGLLTIAIIVVAMDIFVWQPFSSWSKRFSYQMVPYGEEKTENFVLSKFRDLINALNLRNTLSGLKEKINPVVDSIYIFFTDAEQAKRKIASFIKYVVKGFFLFALIYAIYRIILFTFWIISNPWPEEAGLIPSAIAFSIIRLILAYLICLFVVSGFVYLYHSRPKIGDFLFSFFKIAASIPGTALQPIVLAFLLNVGFQFPLELTAILVLISTMFWYLLFPVLGRVQIVPREFKEPVESFTSSKFFMMKKVLLPGSFPAFVTGSLAAWGAGWNALVVAEYSVFNNKTYKTFGIGSLIDQAAYLKGNMVLLTLALVAMVIVIIIINRFIWQPLYNIAAEKYKFEVE